MSARKFKTTTATPRERLEALARKILADYQGQFNTGIRAFSVEIMLDPEAMWELFRPWHTRAISDLFRSELEKAKKSGATSRARESASSSSLPARSTVAAGTSVPQGASPGARSTMPHNGQWPSAPGEHLPNRAGLLSVLQTVRKSLLDTFIVNGRPIGDQTSVEARAWAQSHQRDVLFVERITSGLPDVGRIRDYVTPEEADAAYRDVSDV